MRLVSQALKTLLRASQPSHFKAFSTSTSSFKSAKSRIMAVDKKAHPFTRESFEELMRSRFFYTQSFEIYGGTRCAA